MVELGAGGFDPVTFFKRPQVILRLICLLFAIVVFGCISAGSYDPNGTCLFNGKGGACHYGVGIGVIAFLGCIVFIAIDSQFETFNTPDTKKHVLIADLGFSGLWAFLWFVCFCYLADMWRKTQGSFSTTQTNNCQAAIAFSFFSVITWVGLSVMALSRLRQHIQEAAYGDGLSGDNNPYAPFPPNNSEPVDPYQSRPFSEETQDETAGSDFKAPSY
ncbi:synaptogyrin-3 [Nematostella vectensis]|uniref:synaptogyrin-3 n=1 Tax=Nematostella vectensis TaxID=45351 RepID=UPI0020779457|nr:synaptogyrin-3 [Nematostella vectensis]